MIKFFWTREAFNINDEAFNLKYKYKYLFLNIPISDILFIFIIKSYIN